MARLKIRARGNCREGGVAEQIYAKTNLSLVKFCELNSLSYASLMRGYYSKRAISVFEKYGVEIDNEQKSA